MAKTLTERMLDKIKVKVYKKVSDDRTLLCGEPVQTDKRGEFFVIPAHMADYIRAVFKQYEIDEEFVDGEVKRDAK